MKKFNKDHVETIAIELHDFMEEDMDRRGVDPYAAIDFALFRDKMIEFFEDYYNSERN